MRTQLDIVNRILKRMRESKVTSITQSDYAAMIASLVNEAMTVIQEAHDWSALDHTVEFALVPGQHEYDLSARESEGGDASLTTARLPNQKSYLLWDQREMPQMWFRLDTDTPNTSAHTLYQLNEGGMHVIYNRDPTQQDRFPMYLSLRVRDDGTGWTARVYPTPSEAGTVTMKWWIPQDELDLDGADNNTPIIVRPDVVMAYALRAALNERGEEIGEPGNMADERLQVLLASAIDTDLMNRSRTGRYDVRPE